MTPDDLVLDPWALGPVCFVIDEVRCLPKPIPCRGAQGWWSFDSEMYAPLAELACAPLRRALTLQQPYASAIAVGPKRVENRTVGRRIPPQGLWVGLHAGKTLYRPESAHGRLAAWWNEELSEWRRELWPDAPSVEALPFGAMLGVMHVAVCLRYPEEVPGV